MILDSWTDYSSHFSNINLCAGFTNKNFPHRKPTDRLEFAKLLELDSNKIVEPIQVHSNFVKICTNSEIISDCDGTVTDQKNLVLSIQVADCIPIYLVGNKNVGLLHAGWRGVNSGNVESGIEKMLALNSKLDNIQILLGPSIRQCCFEIGAEVAKLFENKFQKDGLHENFYLDLQGVVKSKLSNLGIRKNNIIDVEECTCCSDNYCSFRRDGAKAGRMIAMIGWRNQ